MTRQTDAPRDQVFQMRIDKATMAQLDELRRIEPDIPSRSDLVRRLIERASAKLKASKR